MKKTHNIEYFARVQRELMRDKFNVIGFRRNDGTFGRAPLLGELFYDVQTLRLCLQKLDIADFENETSEDNLKRMIGSRPLVDVRVSWNASSKILPKFDLCEFMK